MNRKEKGEQQENLGIQVSHPIRRVQSSDVQGYIYITYFRRLWSNLGVVFEKVDKLSVGKMAEFVRANYLIT